jgi:hypothetical protein
VTKPQPQLFVAPSFEALHETLEAVVSELPSAKGGESSLEQALLAAEVATFTLQGGLSVAGRPSRRELVAGSSRLLELRGPARAELGNSVESCAAGAVVLLVPGAPSRLTKAPGSKELDLELGEGLRLKARLLRRHSGAGQGSALLVMESGTLGAGTQLQAHFARGQLLLLSDGALGAVAGAPPEYFPRTDLPNIFVPRPRTLDEQERALLALYQRALEALRSQLGSGIMPVFTAIHRELQQHFKDDWLLRWNLLESLQKLERAAPLAETLRTELLALELRYLNRQPIASGLRYLADLAASPRRDE